MAIALGVAAAIGLFLLGRRAKLEWTLMRSENDSLRPYAERLSGFTEFWLTNSAEPLVFLAQDGTINGVSNAAERMLGQRSVLLIGRPIRSFFADGCEACAAIEKSLTTKEDIKRQTVTMKLMNAPEKKTDLVMKRWLTKHKEEWWILFKG